MRSDPRTRAIAALAIIDEYNALPSRKQGGREKDGYLRAIDALAPCLNEIYGPLPNEALALGQLRRYEDEG